MSSVWRYVAAHVVVVSLLSGCSGLGGADTPDIAVGGETAEKVPPGEAQPHAPDDTAPPADSSERAVELVPCNQSDRAGIESTVGAQTAALARGDYATAYSYASNTFQTAVTLDAFTDLISSSYGPLTASAGLRFGDCLVDAASAVGTLDARFDQDGKNVFALRYVLRESAEGWRVDGASSLSLVGGGA